MKIAVLTCGGIGDAVLCFPIVTALRAQYPGATVTWLGRTDAGALAQAAGLVEAVKPLPAGFWQGGKRGTLSPGTVDYLNGFDLAVSAINDPGDVLKGEAQARVKARFISCQVDFTKPAMPAQHRAALAPLGIAAGADDFGLTKLRDQSDGSLAVLPGASMAVKYWGKESWPALAKASPWPLVIFRDPVNDPRVRWFAGFVDHAALAAGTAHGQVVQSPLAAAATRLGSCSAFVGLESGLSHLAYALGLPGVILWATTGCEAWKPVLPKVKVLNRSATPDEVLAALKSVWPTS